MNLLKKILFPKKIVIWILFPLAMTFMIFSMFYFGSNHIISYISYALSFYSLLIVCLRIPEIIKYFKFNLNKNRVVRKYVEDVNFRINVSLFASLMINIIYSIFQFCLGIYHRSFWYISMSIYYVLLSLMRLFLVDHTRKKKPGDDLLLEYKKYNLCGWIMLLMNSAVTAIIFFIIHFERTFYHHQITTIALAAYTFFTFGLSIYNFIKFRKYKSPVYSAAKSLNLVAGCVSMMTLTTTMLTTFGAQEIIEFKKILLTLVGVVVSLFILSVAIQIIIFTNKRLKAIKEKEEQ